ncbi:MAG: hypothetical protein DYH08_05490 [Actinobacteria bacterium ATB1]|nr:hypothetical protein [Actinobacteria bacterium ATB1]
MVGAIVPKAGLADVASAEAGEGAGTLVLDLDPVALPGPPARPGSPGQRLELGLLVGADHVLVVLELEPSQTRWYRSSTRAAVVAKSGSRGKIQDRYCHSLMASSASHRRMMEVATEDTSPSVTSWAASSDELHRDGDTSGLAGTSHAIALTSATPGEKRTLPH